MREHIYARVRTRPRVCANTSTSLGGPESGAKKRMAAGFFSLLQSVCVKLVGGEQHVALALIYDLEDHPVGILRRILVPYKSEMSAREQLLRNGIAIATAIVALARLSGRSICPLRSY